MNRACAVFASMLMFGLARTAHAGTPISLSDWQMDAVTAGAASAISAFQNSTAGRNTTIQTSVGNIAADRPRASLAQSRTAVLATGTGKASLATALVNQSAAQSHGPAQVATASTTGSALGDAATVHSVAVTTAISASAGPGHRSIGIADSLANVTTFSVSGRSR
jgi:hypothetical protein